MQNFESEYQELVQFIQTLETKVYDNFHGFGETLAHRYKDWNYKIEQIQSKKIFYLKSLDKYERSFKQQNNFMSLKKELGFFQKYSQVMEDKITEIDGEIETQKQKISKKKDLISKYRQLIKNKMKQGACFGNLMPASNQENKEANHPAEDKQPYNEGFFITEHKIEGVKARGGPRDDALKINLNNTYNLFIDCLNTYFNSYLKQAKVSNLQKNPGYDFEVINNLYSAAFNNKKTIGKNIVDLLKTKVGSEEQSLVIKSTSKLYQAVAKISGQNGSEYTEVIKPNMKIEDVPWEIFRGLGPNEVFLALLYKLQSLNVIVYEWQDVIHMNYRDVRKPSKRIVR